MRVLANDLQALLFLCTNIPAGCSSVYVVTIYEDSFRTFRVIVRIIFPAGSDGSWSNCSLLRDFPSPIQCDNEVDLNGHEAREGRIQTQQDILTK